MKYNLSKIMLKAYAHVLPNTKQQEMQQIENGFIGVAVL